MGSAARKEKSASRRRRPATRRSNGSSQPRRSPPNTAVVVASAAAEAASSPAFTSTSTSAFPALRIFIHAAQATNARLPPSSCTPQTLSSSLLRKALSNTLPRYTVAPIVTAGAMSAAEEAEEQLRLRNTPSSRPVIEHTSSKRSISAEHDEETAGNSPLLRPESSQSNEALLAANNGQHRYSTPPSTPPPSSSPPVLQQQQQQQQQQQPETSQHPALRTPEDVTPANAMVATSPQPTETSTVRGIDTNRIRRKPVNSGSPQDFSRVDSRGSAPTPGVDDTPYIRFALDQLTRDEEVRGSRWYPAETTDEEIRAMEGPLERYSTPMEDAMPSSSSPLREERNFSQGPEVFVPFEHEIAPLRFLPAILRPIWLLGFILLCVLMLIALLVSGIWAGTNVGLYGYVNFGGSRYFLFQYLPTLLGMVYLMWVIQIQIAVQRIAPFIALSSNSSRSRSEAPFMEFLPTTFLRPQLAYFRVGQPVIGVCMVIFWLQSLTIPLFASMYNVQFFGPAPTGAWKWNAVQGVTWTLFALYLLLTLALILLGIWIWRQRTGLKWDPRSIADIIALLDRSNITQDYAGAETFGKIRDFRERLDMRTDRLGYWTTSRRPNDVFYGIGEEGGPIRRYSLDGGRIKEKPEIRRSDSLEQIHNEQGNYLDSIQHTYLPWFLRPSVVLLWCVIAILLYLAFLLVSFINNAILYGFDPALHVRSNNAGFSATNFLYSFIPALLGIFLFLAWLNIDYAFRRLQPYAAMSAPHGAGATAGASLLLDYPARLPFSCTMSAIANRCPRVAWFSLLSLISATIPVLAGGCFWAQYYPRPANEVRVSAETSGFYALCVFLALYAFSLPLVFIRLRAAALPGHDCASLAQIISWLYASGVIGEREWRVPLGSKAELVTRLVSAVTDLERTDPALGGAGGQGRFVFGRFVGRDGRVHLGIERVGRLEGEASPSRAENTWPLHSQPPPPAGDPGIPAQARTPEEERRYFAPGTTRPQSRAPDRPIPATPGTGPMMSRQANAPAYQTPAATTQRGLRPAGVSSATPASTGVFPSSPPVVPPLVPPKDTPTRTSRTAVGTRTVADANTRQTVTQPQPTYSRGSWRNTGSGAVINGKDYGSAPSGRDSEYVLYEAGRTAKEKEMMAETRLV